MNKIIFCNRYYRPDHSATAQLLTDLAEYLADSGKEIIVVTSRQRYDDASASLPAIEKISGVTVHRVWTSRRGRDRLIGRALDYATFYLSAFVTLLRIVARNDLLIVKTDPPLLSVVGLMVARIKGARLINWLQDIFPEVARELGIRLPRPLYRFIALIRNSSLRHADVNVVLGQRMAHHLRLMNVDDERIVEINNWVIDRDIRPVEPSLNPLRKEWGLGQKFIVGYSGNLGRAHDFETVYAAACNLAHDSRFQFLFIGSGAGMNQLQARVASDGPSNIQFHPYQPIEQLSNSLSLPDIHWVTLSPALEGLIVPSKSYGILAAGRPLLFVGAADGEIGAMVTKYECGAAIAPGDAQTFVRWICELADNSEQLRTMSDAARELYERNYAYGASLRAWEQLIYEVVGTTACRPA